MFLIQLSSRRKTKTQPRRESREPFQWWWEELDDIKAGTTRGIKFNGQDDEVPDESPPFDPAPPIKAYAR